MFIWVAIGVGITLLPLAVDALNSAFPSQRMSRCTSVFATTVILCAITFLMVLALYKFFERFLFFFHPHYDTLPAILHIIFALWAWFGVILNYAFSVLKDAGRCRPKQISDNDERNRYCKQCDAYTDILSTHCRVCHSCTLLFDHHCPYTKNCIGVLNYRYFFMFLLYLWIGAGYASAMSLPVFYTCWMKPLEAISPDRLQLCREFGMDTLIFVPTFVGFLAVCLLFFFQALLLYVGQTTRDFLRSFPTTLSWLSIDVWKKSLFIIPPPKPDPSAGSIDTRKFKCRKVLFGDASLLWYALPLYPFAVDAPLLHQE